MASADQVSGSAPTPGPVAPSSPATAAPARAGAPRRSTGDGAKRAVASTRNALQIYILARIAQLKRQDNKAQMPVRLSGVRKAQDGAQPRVWQTFSNAVSEAPRKDVAWPFTVTADVSAALAALLEPLARQACLTRAKKGGPEAHKNPELLAQLATDPGAEGRTVAFLRAVSLRMGETIMDENFSREFCYLDDFSSRIEFVARESGGSLDPGARELGRLYLDLLRTVGWYAGGATYEHEHLTLNRSALLSIIQNLSVFCREPGPVGLLGLLRGALSEAKKNGAERAKPAKRPIVTAPAGQSPAPPAGGAGAGSSQATPSSLSNGVKSLPASPEKKEGPGGAPPAGPPRTGGSHEGEPSTHPEEEDIDYDGIEDDIVP